MSSQNKTCWVAGRFYSGRIYVTLYAFCNLMYIAYFLYALHYPLYAHTILYTYTLSSSTSCSASHKDVMTST